MMNMMQNNNTPHEFCRMQLNVPKIQKIGENTPVCVSVSYLYDTVKRYHTSADSTTAACWTLGAHLSKIPHPSRRGEGAAQECPRPV